MICAKSRDFLGWQEEFQNHSSNLTTTIIILQQILEIFRGRCSGEHRHHNSFLHIHPACLSCLDCLEAVDFKLDNEVYHVSWCRTSAQLQFWTILSAMSIKQLLQDSHSPIRHWNALIFNIISEFRDRVVNLVVVVDTSTVIVWSQYSSVVCAF